ncbi:MAG: FRG domain-containing protein [Planctomycetota bacterium]|jgi:hypothetical protein
MPRPKRWESKGVTNGIWTLRLSSWKYFHDYVTQEMLDYSHYVWRGDRCDNRPLLPSFDRLYSDSSRQSIERRMKAHLQVFKEAARGRRGTTPSKLRSENDWWALGQHYGLDTPLLDWTHSAFVALFFAFERTKKPQTRNRAVYAINPGACRTKSRKIAGVHTEDTRPDIVEFFSPQQDENSRLVNQGGLFSRCTAGTPLEDWVAHHWAGDAERGVLLRLLIPDSGRLECLRTLNKMNINYLTLFPDLSGASSHANTVNTIARY